MNNQELFAAVFPALITAFVSIIAMLTSYRSSKNSEMQSYNNNVDSMRFAQREKVADQIAEKAAILFSKCDPNVLNTVINEIVPRRISHEENANIRKYLLGIVDDIQTYSNIIKMLSYSIFDSEEMLKKLEIIWMEMDDVYEMCSDLILHLADIYTSMTPEGEIKGINIMEEKIKLEKTFPEKYKPTYTQLYTLMSDLIWDIRQRSIPKTRDTIKKKKVKKKK